MKSLIAALAFALFCSTAAHAEAVKWEVMPEGSRLAFSGKQMGAAFKGEFKTFSADIVFAADDLANSRAEATVDIASVTTGDQERDTNIVGKEWFDAAQFPSARFVSTAFRKAEGENSFVADGNLTIRDITLPVSLPFTLAFSPDGSAAMKGQLALDRSKFRLGTGDWEDASIIANDVTVDVTLNAKPVQ